MLRREIRVLLRSSAPLPIKGFMAATIVANHIAKTRGRDALNSQASKALIAGVVLAPLVGGMIVVHGGRKLLARVLS